MIWCWSGACPGDAGAPGLSCARRAVPAMLRRATFGVSPHSGDNPLAGQLRYGIARAARDGDLEPAASITPFAVLQRPWRAARIFGGKELRRDKLRPGQWGGGFCFPCREAAAGSESPRLKPRPSIPNPFQVFCFKKKTSNKYT